MMNWQRLLSDKRFGLEDPKADREQSSARSDFERDYDRLVFSTPFRRLQNKTQVFPLPGIVFVHNRLTHSLEVSCVGRSLGNIVGRVLRKRYGGDALVGEGAIGSIVSAACLAHDMGNPPFGHSGERAIGAYFREGDGRKWEDAVRKEGGRWEDFMYFEGNANTLRLLTHQFVGRRRGGFALTYSTLGSIIKYPYGSLLAERIGKFGFFASEEDTMREIAQELGLIEKINDAGVVGYARYPLVYLVEAADDICYQIMDLEDAYKLRILTYDEARDLLMQFFSERERSLLSDEIRHFSDRNEQIAQLRAKVINRLIESCATCFLDAEESILAGDFSGSLLKALASTPEGEAYRECTRMATSRIYPHRDVVDVELAGHRIFASLIDTMMHALTHRREAYSSVLLSRVSSQYNINEMGTYGKLQCTLDYISGMTDIYALDLYRKITGMNLPAV